jgi:hypothetical protein
LYSEESSTRQKESGKIPRKKEGEEGLLESDDEGEGEVVGVGKGDVEGLDAGGISGGLGVAVELDGRTGRSRDNFDVAKGSRGASARGALRFESRLLNPPASCKGRLRVGGSPAVRNLALSEVPLDEVLVVDGNRRDQLDVGSDAVSVLGGGGGGLLREVGGGVGETGGGGETLELLGHGVRALTVRLGTSVGLRKRKGSVRSTEGGREKDEKERRKSRRARKMGEVEKRLTLRRTGISFSGSY